MARPKRVVVTLFGHDKLSGVLAKSGAGLSRWGKKARAVGRGMTTSLTMPIALAAGGVIALASKFESSLLRMQGRLGDLEGTSEGFLALKERAKELGASTAFSASQVAQAMDELLVAGLKPKQVLDAIGPTLDAAVIGEIELAEAARLGATQLKAWGKDASELPAILDALTNASFSTKSTITSLADGMAKVAPIANTMGLAFNETAASIALLQDQGIEATESGVALKTILGSIANVSSEAGARLAELGVSKDRVLTAGNDLKGFALLVDELLDKGANTGDLFEIFGKRGAVGIAALMQAGGAGIAGLSEKLEKSGTAAEFATLLMSESAGGIKEFVSAIESLAIAIGDSGVLSDFTALIKGTATWVRELGKSNPLVLKMAFYGGLVLAAIGPLIIIMGMFAASISAIIAAAPLMGAALAVAFGPIGLAIAIIGALITAGGLLWSNWDTIAAGIGEVMAGLSGTFSELADGFSKKWGDVVASFERGVDLLPDFIKTRLGVEVGGGATAPGAGGATAPIGVGGELAVHIDSEGRPSVTKLSSTNPLVPVTLEMGTEAAMP